MIETLHREIIRTALPGASKRECPGGYVAYIGKHIDDGRCAVVYVHHNTDQRIHDMTWKQVREFVLA